MLNSNHISQILAIAKEVRQLFPRGKNKDKCFYACSMLQDRLEDIDDICVSIQFGWFSENTHCWIEVWNNCSPVIVDVTVDQFGEELPEILFDSPSNWP